MYAAIIGQNEKVIANVRVSEIPKTGAEKKIEIAGSVTKDGAPVNVKTYQYSTAKKYQKNEAGFLLKKEHNGREFFVF